MSKQNFKKPLDAPGADFGKVPRPNVWGLAPVEDEPEIVLSRWRIVEIEDGNRIFVGHDGHQGRVSSPIQTFDFASRKGVTRSGRVYYLRGKFRYDPDAEYVLAYWLRINGQDPTKCRDVSEQVQNEM